MAALVVRSKTSLGPEEVIARAVQFFSTAKWRATSQSGRSATFARRPRVSWVMVALTVLGFVACVVPGIIMLRKIYQLQNLVVTARAAPGGSEVTVQYPLVAKRLTARYLQALPDVEPVGVG